MSYDENRTSGRKVGAVFRTAGGGGINRNFDVGVTVEIPNLDQIVSKVGDLPSLPTIAIKVMEMVGDPRTSVSDLQHVISSDQALAARILKIANSALFATRSEITTISHAVVILGFTTLRSVVMASSIQRVFMDGSRRVGSLGDSALWEHSLAVAIAARELATRMGTVSAEEAFVSGLLHDIGKLVLNKNLEKQYQDVLNEVFLGNETFIDAENRILGFNHAHLGALVARKWKLPDIVANAIFYHHNPEMAQQHVKNCALACVANMLIVTAGIGLEKREEEDWDLFEPVKVLGLSGPVVREIKTRSVDLFISQRHALLG